MNTTRRLHNYRMLMQSITLTRDMDMTITMQILMLHTPQKSTEMEIHGRMILVIPGVITRVIQGIDILTLTRTTPSHRRIMSILFRAGHIGAALQITQTLHPLLRLVLRTHKHIPDPTPLHQDLSHPQDCSNHRISPSSPPHFPEKVSLHLSHRSHQEFQTNPILLSPNLHPFPSPIQLLHANF